VCAFVCGRWKRQLVQHRSCSSWGALRANCGCHIDTYRSQPVPQPTQLRNGALVLSVTHKSWAFQTGRSYNAIWCLRVVLMPWLKYRTRWPVTTAVCIGTASCYKRFVYDCRRCSAGRGCASQARLQLAVCRKYRKMAKCRSYLSWRQRTVDTHILPALSDTIHDSMHPVKLTISSSGSAVVLVSVGVSVENSCIVIG